VALSPLAGIGLKDEVVAIDLVVPPLPDDEIAAILDGDSQPLKRRLRFAWILQLLEVLS
jgi:hypothetical protein